MHRQKIGRWAVLAVCALAVAIPSYAQQTTPPAKPGPPVPEKRPLFLAGVRTSGPLEKSATVGLLIPLRPLERGTDFGSNLFAFRGVLLEAAGGPEGFEVAAGWGRRYRSARGPALFGQDVLATAFRKTTTDTTYVGGEAGITTFGLRVSVGAATRVAGPLESDRTIFTWGIGFHIGR